MNIISILPSYPSSTGPNSFELPVVQSMTVVSLGTEKKYELIQNRHINVGSLKHLHIKTSITSSGNWPCIMFWIYVPTIC